ncbi:hypothetical protein ABZV58_05860 [Nocardia sp. NPDC004654]|uniref:hypothetical protein n=1 Tax=Nocardia sp. NPDC004654 TaxID=3154776 RepID=UPI0033A83187
MNAGPDTTKQVRPSTQSLLVGHDALVDSDHLVSIELLDMEREVLSCGLREWGGPARCTDALAAAMGFRNVEDLFEEGRRLRPLLIDGEPMSAKDWRRTVIATEFAFASDVFGSGTDWSITTGFSDAETIKILRGLQRKIGGTLREALYGPRRVTGSRRDTIGLPLKGTAALPNPLPGKQTDRQE